MATISEIKGGVALCHKALITPFIWGVHGLGKSSAIRQYCEKLGIGFIDVRCSQLEASDLRGLPDRGEDGRTHYLPPADMPVGDLTTEQIERTIIDSMGDILPKELNGQKIDYSAGSIPWGDIAASLTQVHQTKLVNLITTLHPRCESGILFLDEVNRAPDDVLQAIFQLILDRRIGQYALPVGWGVVCAGNFNEGYITNGFNDAALMDRFCHMVLSHGDSTMEEWINYTGDKFGEYGLPVIEFVSTNLKYLDGEPKGKMDVPVLPSRRSWEAVIRAEMTHAKHASLIEQFTKSERALQIVMDGLLGTDTGTAYRRYNCPVKARQLTEHGVAKYKPIIMKLPRDQMSGLMWGLASYIVDKINEEKYAECALDFMEILLEGTARGTDNDLALAFLKYLVKNMDEERMKKSHMVALAMNPTLAARVVQHRKDTGAKDKGFLEYIVKRPKIQQMYHASIDLNYLTKNGSKK